MWSWFVENMERKNLEKVPRNYDWYFSRLKFPSMSVSPTKKCQSIFVSPTTACSSLQWHGKKCYWQGHQNQIYFNWQGHQNRVKLGCWGNPNGVKFSCWTPKLKKIPILKERKFIFGTLNLTGKHKNYPSMLYIYGEKNVLINEIPHLKTYFLKKTYLLDSVLFSTSKMCLIKQFLA